MGCVNGKSRTIKTNIATASVEEDAQQNNVINNGNSNNDSKQNKNTKKDQENKRKRKKKKDSSAAKDGATGANNEGSSLLSPSTSTNVSGVQRRPNPNGSILYRYSNSSNQEDTFDSINESKSGSNSFQNYLNVASDRLHKNFQDRLGGTQTSRNGQKLSDSQLEFFKMLDEKIAQGDETDDS